MGMGLRIHHVVHGLCEREGHTCDNASVTCEHNAKARWGWCWHQTRKTPSDRSTRCRHRHQRRHGRAFKMTRSSQVVVSRLIPHCGQRKFVLRKLAVKYIANGLHPYSMTSLP